MTSIMYHLMSISFDQNSSGEILRQQRHCYYL
jgi:hypothetical protein